MSSSSHTVSQTNCTQTVNKQSNQLAVPSSVSCSWLQLGRLDPYPSSSGCPTSNLRTTSMSSDLCSYYGRDRDSKEGYVLCIWMGKRMKRGGHCMCRRSRPLMTPIQIGSWHWVMYFRRSLHLHILSKNRLDPESEWVLIGQGG